MRDLQICLRHDDHDEGDDDKDHEDHEDDYDALFNEIRSSYEICKYLVLP